MNLRYNFGGQQKTWQGSMPLLNAMIPAERATVIMAMKRSRNAAFACFYQQKHLVDEKQTEADQLRVANHNLKQRVDQLRTLRRNKEIPTHVLEGCLANMGIKAKTKEDGNTEFECPICKEDLDDLDEISMTSTCGHVFHRDCIAQYIATAGLDSNKCPTCRGHILVDRIYTLDEQARESAQGVIDLTEKEPRIIIRTLPPRARSKRIADSSSSSSSSSSSNKRAKK